MCLVGVKERTLSSFMKRFRSLSTSSRSTVRKREGQRVVSTGVFPVRQAVEVALQQRLDVQLLPCTMFSSICELALPMFAVLYWYVNVVG